MSHETPNAPLTPRAPDYEDITLREVTLGFASGPQDITLYPEDELHLDGEGRIRSITFKSMGSGHDTFVVYPGQAQWHSLRHTPHRRVKGTSRPTPEQLMARFKEREQQEKQARLQKRLRQLADDGLIGQTDLASMAADT